MEQQMYRITIMLSLLDDILDTKGLTVEAREKIFKISQILEEMSDFTLGEIMREESE